MARMADDYDAEAVDHEEVDDAFSKEGYEPYRENVVFLIDSSPAMFEKAELDDEAFKNKTWMEVAIKVVKEVLKTRICASDNDQFAAVFYGTREHQNANSFDNIYTLQDLDVPDAQRIRELDKLAGGEFEATIGSKGENSPEHLRYALWSASQQLTSGASSAKASKRILIFTRDQNPPDGNTNAREQILSRAQELQETKVAMELFPMISPSETFDTEVFWQDLLKTVTDDEMWQYEGSQMALRLSTLSSAVRLKAYKKRSLASIKFTLSDDFKIAVKLFAMLQTAKRPSPEWLEAKNNQPLRSETAYICNDTGAVLTDTSKRSFPKQQAEGKELRFPQVVVSTDELAELQHVQPPGLQLLGFKPVEALKDHHQIRSPTFVYPDERSLQGSTTFFIALHSRMVLLGKMAVCSFTRTRSSKTVLVALLPQEELVGEDGTQLDPPGLQMIYLPFADEIRYPERDSNFVGESFPVATDDQVDAAAEVIKKLDLQGFSSAEVPNPHLQRHYQVLEALALGEDPSALVPQDYTRPDEVGLAAANGVIMAFKEAVYGAGYTEDVAPVKGSAAKKRKAPEVVDNGIDYRGMAANGQLSSLTVPTLKVCCDLHALSKAGVKAAIIERITAHFSTQTT